MKRSRSDEIGPESKRRRVDAGQTKSFERLEVNTNAIDAIDLPSFQSDLIPNAAANLTNATTIGDLPLEVLGNHVFKFFDFKYWLKHFVTVCKSWQLAAERSTVEKQLRVCNCISTTLATIARYKVSNLIIDFDGDIHEVATLINASPRVRFVMITGNIATENSASIFSKFSFPNVSTVMFYSKLTLLRLFPNVTKVGIINHMERCDITIPSVLELVLPATHVSKRLMYTMKSIFPSVHTIYYLSHPSCFMEQESNQKQQLYNEEDYDEAALDDWDNSFLEEIKCAIVPICQFATGRSSQSTSYADYFNCFGSTLFCNSSAGVRYLDEVEPLQNHSLDLAKLQRIFELFPSLSIEYEQDFLQREINFAFPYFNAIQKSSKLTLTSIDWMKCTDEVFQFCIEKNMLPLAGYICYYMLQDDYENAIYYFTLASTFDQKQSRLIYKVPSWVQFAKDIGYKTFTSIIDAEIFCGRIYCSDFEDLTPIKDLFPREVLKSTFETLVDPSTGFTRIGDFIWQYLILIDSWLHPSTSQAVTSKCIGVEQLSCEAQELYHSARLARDFKHVSKPQHVVSKLF